MKSILTFTAVVALVLASSAFLSGCDSGGKGIGVTGTATDTGSATDIGFGTETTGTDIGVGSGTGSGTGTGTGGLSSTDQAALQSAAGAEAQIAPSNASDAGLSAQLQAAAKKLLEEEAAGKDVAAKKIALAGQILTQCAAKVSPLAPIPGQPLMGTWNGGGQCPVSFEVGAHSGNGVYAVAGGTNGKLQADQQGAGAIQGDPFSGNVVDSGLNGVSGAGTLTHPTFFKSKSGTSPCSVTVQLQTPKSPIPANYDQAMRIFGRCLRQALILLSPAMDRIFKNMDPAVAAQLQKQFLGIQ